MRHAGFRILFRPVHLRFRNLLYQLGPQAVDFDLYPMTEIIESKLFGDGEENEIFRDALGDYLAIAKTDKTLIYTGDDILNSHHAGYTDDEIYVPLIMVKTKKNN